VHAPRDWRMSPVSSGVVFPTFTFAPFGRNITFVISRRSIRNHLKWLGRMDPKQFLTSGVHHQLVSFSMSLQTFDIRRFSPPLPFLGAVD
jgi:hypothetical protein